MPTKPDFHVPPLVGETLDAWLDRVYSDEARGPQNHLILSGIIYIALDHHEMKAFRQDASALWPFLKLTDDPTLFVGPVGKHYLLQLDGRRLDVRIAEGPEPICRREVTSRLRGSLLDVVRVWTLSEVTKKLVLLDDAAMTRVLGPRFHPDRPTPYPSLTR